MELHSILTYPLEREDWLRTVLIGGILTFIGFLIVPLLLVYGYVVRTIRVSLDGDAEPPAFTEWKELLVSGLQAFLISIVYLLIPLVIAGLTAGSAIAAFATGSETGVAIGAGTMFVGLTVSAVLALFFSYLGVGAVVNFARKGEMSAAFDFEILKTVALDKSHATAWLIALAVLAVASFVSMVPVIGWVLAPFASFYAAVVAANLWASGFSQAMDSLPRVMPPASDEPAL